MINGMSIKCRFHNSDQLPSGNTKIKTAPTMIAMRKEEPALQTI
jgi:hypothetical protein